MREITSDATSAAANESREVRVFLSSTFRDFMEERELLAKQVFPELNRRARERGVELVEVDLRWGVTQAQAALMLYAGIPDRAALAEAQPETLLRQLGRFQRQLLGRDAPPLDLSLVLGWIRRARGGPGRSPN